MKPAAAVLAGVFQSRGWADKPIAGAEVGVWWGGTSEVLLRAFPLLTLLMVDKWEAEPPDTPYRASGDPCALVEQSELDKMVETARNRTRFAEARRVILRMRSTQAAEFPHTLDFAFIDAGHDYRSVSADIAAYWPKIRPGGLLLGHDYDRPDRWRQHTDGVTQAVNEFVAREKLTLRKEDGCVWWVER